MIKLTLPDGTTVEFTGDLRVTSEGGRTVVETSAERVSPGLPTVEVGEAGPRKTEIQERQEASAPEAKSQPALELSPADPKPEPKRRGRGRPKMPKPGEPTEEEKQVITRILAKLGERNGVSYEGAKHHVGLLLRQLRKGRTETDLRTVIAYCCDELGWDTKEGMRPYLRPETLFGPQTIERYLDAARAWAVKLEKPSEPKPDDLKGNEPAWWGAVS